ncbi:MAG TPA: mechanosensitive ion channel domain-containing protein [Puia sp.]|nr:mechanosensitive ion channel domain-containing protein [Puia sp.]
MHDFWNRIILSNPVKSYVFVAIAILIGLLFKRILSKLVADILYRLASTVGKDMDKDAFVNLLIGPLETFLVIFITLAALHDLKFPEELNFDVYEVSSKDVVHGIARTTLIVVFIWLLLRIIDFIAVLLRQKAQSSGDMKEHQLVVFFRDFLKVIIAIIGILMILGYAFGFEVSKLWTGLGIAGAALALATKESIENLIASFIIFFDKPFTTGDLLKVNTSSGLVTGNVEKIGLRSTRIRTDQKTFVTVPNKQMVDSVVDNQTLRTQRKAELRLQIGLSTSSDLINQFIDGIEKILRKEYIENPTVFLNDIAGSAFLINADYFTAPISIDEFNKIKERVNLEILKLMEGLHISIAGASTDVRVIQS